jgi:hypothetical protein
MDNFFEASKPKNLPTAIQTRKTRQLSGQFQSARDETIEVNLQTKDILHTQACISEYEQLRKNLTEASTTLMTLLRSSVGTILSKLFTDELLQIEAKLEQVLPSKQSMTDDLFSALQETLVTKKKRNTKQGRNQSQISRRSHKNWRPASEYRKQPPSRQQEK